MLRFHCLIILSTLLPYAQSAESERPNILFCISDDQSWMHAGAYGCRWVSTPAFDRVGREGLLFLNAYTPNAKCAPSRACILTGRNSWELEAACNHWCYFPEQFKRGSKHFLNMAIGQDTQEKAGRQELQMTPMEMLGN